MYRTRIIWLCIVAAVVAGLSIARADDAGSGPDFEASGVTLLGWIDLPDFPGDQIYGSDLWGYVSPSGREYAIMGLYAGTAFVEITEPTAPNIVGYVPGPWSIWREMKTYGHYCYIVSQEGDGLQIVDLADIDNGVVNHVSTSNLNGAFFASHNIALNTESGYAYPVLADINPSLTAVSLANPLDPQIAGMWHGPRIHDVLVVTYHTGPYAGREIAFACCEASGLYIVDVTNKANMFTIGSLAYPNVSYSHQGWLSSDRRYFFLDDELDELFGAVPTTTTYVIDVADLSAPFLETTFTNGLPATDHNLMVRGHYIYEANYQSGLRIFDYSDIDRIVEVGFFDTFPENDFVGFSGAWGVHHDFPSRNVIVSDRQRGLFILDTSAHAPPTPGDNDDDGDIDRLDFKHFVECESAAHPAVSCAIFDFDHDGDVDWADFARFQLAFTGP